VDCIYSVFEVVLSTDRDVDYYAIIKKFLYYIFSVNMKQNRLIGDLVEHVQLIQEDCLPSVLRDVSDIK
jgi:hypothetical protein